MPTYQQVKYLRKIFFYILAGICFGVFVHFFLVFRQGDNRNNLKNSPSVSPYYEESAFRPILIPSRPVSDKKIYADSIKIPIIMYHYIEYVKDKGDIIRIKLDTTPDQFEKQLLSLKNAHYETYFVKDIPEILKGNIDYSTKSAVLTFDDGYSSFYKNAFPLLKKYHMRGTVYIIQNTIGKEQFMSHQQIQELIDSQLIEIGSHTLTHANLKTMNDWTSRKQIVESKHLLEKEFNIKIETFAYPNGGFNLRTVELVKEASYSAAVSVISGTMQSEENLFYLSRIRPGIFSGDINIIERINK